MALRLHAALSASAAVAAAAAVSASLKCGPAGPDYSAHLDGAPLFSKSAPLFIFTGAQWLTTFVLTSSAPVQGTDGLGTFRGTSCVYASASSPGVPLIALSAFTYNEADARATSSLVRFKYSFPSGLPQTNFTPTAGATMSTISNFPAFAGPSPLPNVITWSSDFMQPSTTMADSLGIAGGPVLFFGADVAGAAVMLSPLDQFLTSALGDQLSPTTACTPAAAPGCWVAGVASAIVSIPPGFEQSWLLVAARGLTETVESWGDVLRAEYGVTSTKIADGTVTTLGYTTDNGAMLGAHGCPGQVLDACMLEEKAYLDSINVTLGYLSFQNKWWIGGSVPDESAPWCVSEWVPNVTRVPMGMKAFQEALGLPLQLYAPYFCNSTAYKSNFTMVRSDTKLATNGGCDGFDFFDAAPEEAEAFYDFLLSLGQDYGMFSFEPDFLHQNHACVPEFVTRVGAADMFFHGQTSVALSKGLPVQWCFATPYLLLWTLNAPSVTNFRVSLDFYYGRSWDIGISSLLVRAMGAAPSKDTFWSSSQDGTGPSHGGCDASGCPPDHSAAGARLHTMLALFTAGPVQFSDAPNMTDRALIMRTCDGQGNLLQPSRPIIAVDSTHDVKPGAAPAGYVLGTHTAVPAGGRAWMNFIVAHQLTQPFTLRSLDVYPPLRASSPYAIANWTALRGCADGQPAAACGVSFVTAPTSPQGALSTLPTTAAGTDPYEPALLLLAPVCALAQPLALFGEVDVFATISILRFTDMSCEADRLTLTMSGLPSETVRLGWASGGVVSFGQHTWTAGTARSSVECALTAAAGLVCK